MGIVEPLQGPLTKRPTSFDFEANEEAEILELSVMITCSDSISSLKSEEEHRRPTLERRFRRCQSDTRLQK